MASALYVARCLSVDGATVSIELQIVHPDISEFGTDRLFAWKLLHEWVSPADDGTDVELASRYVKSVKLSPLRNAKKKHVGKDFYTVTRVGEQKPSVTYTIVVTEPLLLSGIKAGDSDEVYDFVEPGKGDALVPPPKVSKPKPSKPKKAAAAPDIPVKTYADLRQLALEGIRKHGGSWSSYLIENGMIDRWAQTERDAQILSYLEFLTPEHRVAAACVVALTRLRARQTEAAKAFLSYAESHYQASEDYNWSAGGGLCALWWRLQKESQADALFARIETEQTERKTNHNQAVHVRFSILAQGGKWDRAEQLIPSLLKDGSYRADLLVPGVLAAWEDHPSLFAKVMDHWQMRADERSMSNYELSTELCRREVARGTPEKYLASALRWHHVLDGSTAAAIALLRTEQNDPNRAIADAQTVLSTPQLGSYVQEYGLAVLTRHARPLADRFVEQNLPTWLRDGYGHGFLAAADRTELLGKHLENHPAYRPASVARLFHDRGAAIAMIKQAMTADMQLGGSHFVDLVDLGERAFVDEQLRSALLRLAKEPTRQRDLPCRSLAMTAAQVGMPEHGFAAIKLPGPALRRYSASDMVSGAVSVRDFGTAYAAAMLVPDDDSNGRVSSLIQGVLRGADEQFLQGPRALPLSVRDVDYARALCAAGERDAVAWMLSAHRQTLSDAEKRAISELLAK